MHDPDRLMNVIIDNTPFRRNVFNMIPEGAGRILDFGCGEGGLILRLKRDKACTDLHALEIDPQDTVRLEGLVDHVWRADYEKGEALPPEYAGYFNYVILHDVVEHLFDPWVTLSRVRELVADGGRMIVSTPNIN
jgi:2-polyprenyl-3-methyl-5-hydroxy-6-metoxy-1,4-benzoquinol methylase